MKVRIHHKIDYLYEEEVSFSPHQIRLFPRSAFSVEVRSMRFQTNPGSDPQYRNDLFDNRVALCFYPFPDRILTYSIDLEVSLTPVNPFHFLLDSHALEFPFQYTSSERHALAPYLLQQFAPVLLPFWQPKKQPTIEALVELNSAIHRNLTYERREEGAAYTPKQLLETQKGACRDFTVLLAETLRFHGIAARLVSGYLCEFDSAEKRAEGALHAWVEACLPGAGWVGMDPTNGTFCDHHHISTSVGLVPADIAPVTGNYFHPTHVPSTMTANLEIIPCQS